MSDTNNQTDVNNPATPNAPENSADARDPSPSNQLIRGTGSGRSKGRDIFYITVLVLLVGAATFLLASSGARHRLFERVNRVWYGATGQEQAEIFKLPAPPPKSVEPKMVYQGRPGPPPVFRAGEAREPVIIRTDPSAGQSGEEEAAPATPGPPEKTTGSKSAYDTLLAKSPVAQKLAGGTLEGYKFKEWKPVRNSPPEFWVDLVATGKTGLDSHFVWAVNSETGTVEAKSQDARDAERRGK